MNKLPHISIQNVTKNDLDEIVSLEKKCFVNDAFSRQQFHYLINRARREFVVVKIQEKIIAYMILLKRKNSKMYRIYSIAILPDYRGLGIAQKLLEYAENIALKNKINKIALEVSENNTVAINLYQNQGYIIKDYRPSYYSDGSTAIIMIKEF